MAATVLRQVRTVITGLVGAPYYSTIYVESGLGTPSQVLSDVQGFWTSLAPLMAASVRVTVDPTILLVNDETGMTVGSEAGAAPAVVSGSNTGEPLPTQVQGLVNWYTAAYVVGRRLRGRFFLPGMTEQNSDGQIQAASVTTIQNSATGLITTLQGHNTPMRILSRAHGTSAPVTTGKASTMFATLRSRSVRGR